MISTVNPEIIVSDALIIYGQIYDLIFVITHKVASIPQ
jgi:hypothetical protein